MKAHDDSAVETPEAVLKELHELVAEAERIIRESAAGGTAHALGALRERLEAAQERVGELYEGAKKKVLAGAHGADEAIRAHPYPAIAVAAGLGLLVGVLLESRRR